MCYCVWGLWLECWYGFEACCLGGLCSGCVAGHFLFCLSGDRVQFLFAELNPYRIADSCYLALDWMEYAKKSNKIAARPW